MSLEGPTLVARIGGNELDFTFLWGIKNQTLGKNLVQELKVTAGVFDIDDDSTKETLCQEYMDAISDIDLLVSWRREEKYFDCHERDRVGLTDLEVFRATNPFTKSLKGKILIVSPFVDTINSQITKAHSTNSGTAWRLFNFDEVEFVFYKPLQTHGSSPIPGINSWGSALEYQKQQIAKIDFDVAFLSCGAYGLPIGRFIKSKLGKKAVVVGGVLQLYFDIIGKRWEKNRRIMNSLDKMSLVRPSLLEVPKNASDIESSAYY